MPVAKAWCVALIGVEGHLVEVEAHLADGIPTVSLVGLPDTALREARGPGPRRDRQLRPGVAAATDNGGPVAGDTAEERKRLRPRARRRDPRR
jgi:hypothetical protein